MSKTAIVTGASRGIGAATAKKLAANGFTVALIYNSSQKAAADVASDIKASGNKAEMYKCDITDSKAVNNTVERIISDLGCVDVLVNNAGIAQQKLFCDITDDEWHAMLEADLSGAFYFSRAVLKYMAREHSGRIINISSMWGETGGSCEVHYSAAKAGVIGMTKALAKEVALSGITVNAVSPGVIMTDMMSGFSSDDIDALKEEIPLARLGNADDVAGAVAFLASDEAAYITGQVLSVNGGLVI